MRRPAFSISHRALLMGVRSIGRPVECRNPHIEGARWDSSGGALWLVSVDRADRIATVAHAWDGTFEMNLEDVRLRLRRARR